MDEIHRTPYFRHIGYQKKITTTSKQQCWHGIKKDIVEYIYRCQMCQQVKVVHQHVTSPLQTFPIPKWKWKVISIDL